MYIYISGFIGVLGFPKTRAYNKDYHLLESILGSPLFWEASISGVVKQAGFDF